MRTSKSDHVLKKNSTLAFGTNPKVAGEVVLESTLDYIVLHK